jgi:DNA adenine methylase
MFPQLFTMQLQPQLKPFLKWVGGKSQLLPEIIKRLPSEYDRYFEPFLGGGAVFFSLQNRTACLVDVNSELINTYCVIKDCVEELIGDLAKHIYDKDYYYSLRDVDRSLEYQSWSNIQRASRFIYLNKTCYNGLYRVNSKQQFNTPIGTYKNPKILDKDNLKACSEVLKDVELIHGSFLAIESKITDRDLVYFDPPYVPLTKTANFTSYTCERFDKNRQIELYKLCCRLHERGVKFMLSNSSAPFVLELYGQEPDFKIELIQATRLINSQSDKRGQIAEAIVTNYQY